MKKIFYIAKSCFLLILLTSPFLFSGQSWIYFSGTITDELTGNPVPQHPVIITNADSIPLSSSTTNINGYYFDSIAMDSLGFAGEIFVSTPDCSNFMISEIFTDPQVYNFADFEICVLPSNCMADFVFQADSINPFTYHFTDLSSGNISNWYWNFGDGTSSNLQNPSHQFNSFGLYEICLTVSDSTTNCLNTLCVNVYVSDSGCVSSFEWDQLDEEELTIAFSDLSLGNIDQWIWDFGDGQSGFEPSPIHTYTQPGNYLVSLSIFDSSLFCSSYSEQWVNVTGMSDCKAGFTVILDTLNNTPHVYFFENISTGNYSNLLWDFGDGSYSQETNPIHTYSDGGTYEVCLSVFSNDSVLCSDTYCDSLETMNYYSFGGHAFLGNYPLNVDENDSSNIAVASLFRRIENKWELMEKREFWKYGYYWFVDKPEGDYLVRTDLLPQSTAFDQYSPTYLPNVRFWENASTFTLENNEEFAVDLQLLEMASNESGIGSIYGLLKSDFTCFSIDVVGSELVYLLNSENEIVAYTYTDQSGNFNFEGLGFDTYLLKAEVTGKSGSAFNVNLTPENPSVTDVVLEVGCESFVGTPENHTSSGFVISNVYPQPATTELTVELKGSVKNEVIFTLFNSYGIKVLSRKAFGSGGDLTFELNVSDLPPGIYLLQVNETNSMESIAKKIILN